MQVTDMFFDHVILNSFFAAAEFLLTERKKNDQLSACDKDWMRGGFRKVYFMAFCRVLPEVVKPLVVMMRLNVEGNLYSR